MTELDPIDRRILAALQRDADQPVEQIGEHAGLSRNACWRRIKRLQDDGVIKGKVALCDAEALGLGLSVFIAVRTDRHDQAWLDEFHRAVDGLPEILGAYRTSGELDYLLHARVTDVAAYDRLYRKLINRVTIKDISASFVMEELKETTALPVV